MSHTSEWFSVHFVLERVARAQGKKGALNPGEVLYNANEVEPHLALELTERLIRLALESSGADEPAEDDEEIELDENGTDVSWASYLLQIW